MRACVRACVCVCVCECVCEICECMSAGPTCLHVREFMHVCACVYVRARVGLM